MTDNVLIIGSISFNEEELDYESDAGNPVVMSSFGSVQIFDSYLINGSREYKLYRPTPNNLTISYKISLICSREKIQLINNLILEQSQFVKEFRKSRNIDIINGFNFKYKNVFNTYVWLTSFSRDSSFFNVETGEEKIRCKLEVQESE